MSRCAVCREPAPEGRATCSPACHEQFVAAVQDAVGQDKRVLDAATGVAYRVPVRHIVENGLRYDDLAEFPRWDE